MKYLLRNKLLGLCVVGFMCSSAWAEVSLPSADNTKSAENERLYLVQLVNQINAMLPIIQAAKKQQPKNTRVTFHYSTYQDAKGQTHNGLLEDMQAIKHGIEQRLDAVTIEPRTQQPIRGDYLSMETP